MDERLLVVVRGRSGSGMMRGTCLLLLEGAELRWWDIWSRKEAWLRIRVHHWVHIVMRNMLIAMRSLLSLHLLLQHFLLLSYSVEMCANFAYFTFLASGLLRVSFRLHIRFFKRRFVPLFLLFRLENLIRMWQAHLGLRSFLWTFFPFFDFLW